MLPGEIAAVGGVLASRGRVSLPLLMLVVVAAAIIGPLVGYEVGQRMGGRVIGCRSCAGYRARWKGRRRAELARCRRRAGPQVHGGAPGPHVRAGGNGQDAYRTFVVYNDRRNRLGIGYCLLGYLTGSAYAAIGRQIGAGFAIAIAALVVTALAIWAVRRYRRPAGVGREHRARLRLISRGARAPAEVRGGLWAMRPERAPRPWRIHLPGDDHAAHLSVSAWVQATTTLVVTWKCV